MRISDWSSDVCSSDLSFRWNWRDLKRLPRMGIFPRPGTLLMLLEVLLLSRPAIMKLCPEPSSTVVSADRLLSAGTSELREKSSSDTVGRTHIDMRPSDSTVGVKARCTQYRTDERSVGKGRVHK